MRITGFAAGPFQTNCYIVEERGRALVVDPGLGAYEAVTEHLAREGASLEAVVLTHGHIDHTRDAAKFGVDTFIHPADDFMLERGEGVSEEARVLYDASGDTLAEIAYVVGKKASNNVAEYHGLLRGLEAAREVGATQVEVFMDSKLVVEQMTGRWKIKHPDMQKLARQARDLASGFDSVNYTWVPRAKNKKADELSNVAMDAAARGDKPGIVKGTGVWVGEKQGEPEGVEKQTALRSGSTWREGCSRTTPRTRGGRSAGRPSTTTRAGESTCRLRPRT